jgi:hypothetical protein
VAARASGGIRWVILTTFPGLLANFPDESSLIRHIADAIEALRSQWQAGA